VINQQLIAIHKKIEEKEIEKAKRKGLTVTEAHHGLSLAHTVAVRRQIFYWKWNLDKRKHL
jgi:hypothetical protein